MMPEGVDRMIANYREYDARCAFLERDIQETERHIQLMRDTLVEDMVHITPTLTGMPGNQKGTSDATGRLACAVADGIITEQIREAINSVEVMKYELAEKLPTVVFVNAWVRTLDNKERFVVEQKVLGGLSWRQLVYTFKRQFGDIYSQQGLRRIKDSAMDKIYKIAQ